MSETPARKKPALSVPKALRVAVVTAATTVAATALTAAAFEACDPVTSGPDAGDAGEQCYVWENAAGQEIYRDCPNDAGDGCTLRIYPDGAVRDGPC